MKAKEAMSVTGNDAVGNLPVAEISAGMPLLAVLPRLLESPGHRVAVVEEGKRIGVITETSLLEAFGRMIASRDDSSILTVECAASDFSASAIAHAVESADVHLVDMLTAPAPDGKVSVMLRVRSSDEEGAARSLERYGYQVTEREHDNTRELELAFDRLLELQTILNL